MTSKIFLKINYYCSFFSANTRESKMNLHYARPLRHESHAHYLKQQYSCTKNRKYVIVYNRGRDIKINSRLVLFKNNVTKLKECIRLYFNFGLIFFF